MQRKRERELQNFNVVITVCVAIEIVNLSN